MDAAKKIRESITQIRRQNKEKFCFPAFYKYSDSLDEADKRAVCRRAYTLSIIAAGGCISKDDLIETLQYIEEMVYDIES
ncbi:MAG: hypothetical protein ACIAQZ_12335 [Sedimentisphaeraceae bacterium JB056]